jgi:hypothetical protein
MRSLVIPAAAAALMVTTNTASLAQVREVSYLAVKVELPETYKPDAAFETMRKAFAGAAAQKDMQALFSLVGPTFVWLSQQGGLSDQFDSGRDAMHNFKVAFGFREFGKDTDGGVADGPFWDVVAVFAADKTFFADAGTRVCGPTVATIVDEDGFDKARQTIGADDSVEWYFTVADTPATAAPTGGALVGRVNQVAVPVLDRYPPLPAQGEPPPATSLQVLLPAPVGKKGWIPASAGVPLVTDRLCYALTSRGEWKISTFDQVQ